ncbi:MAG: YiiD C-terminal domain-containing protein [Devosia sp.]|nr:YiiD C-terminal domain-containing protein [Devosia sp.]
MTPAELETYLHTHIPLSRAMSVGVVTIAADRVVLSAPLAPNINHRATVFGGSASAVAILAAWSLLHLRLTAAGFTSRLVIQRNTMDYLAPIAGDFIATGHLASETDWPAFTRLLARRGRARIGVDAVVEFEGREAGRLHGDFVALGKGE